MNSPKAILELCAWIDLDLQQFLSPEWWKELHCWDWAWMRYLEGILRIMITIAINWITSQPLKKVYYIITPIIQEIFQYVLCIRNWRYIGELAEHGPGLPSSREYRHVYNYTYYETYKGSTGCWWEWHSDIMAQHGFRLEEVSLK